MNTFDNASAHAKPDCPKCNGTGSYMYDHNHSTICNLCCTHNMGWWKLEKHYGENNGKWCCRAGCGKTVEECTMNIGFFDPISERWIKPRPEPEREIPAAMSLGEALLLATEAAAIKERNERIWALLKQTAEGCNAIESAPIVTSEPAEYVEPSGPVMIMQERLFFVASDAGVFEMSADAVHYWSGAGGGAAPLAAEQTQEYEPVESLGYVYWKPRVTI